MSGPLKLLLTGIFVVNSVFTRVIIFLSVCRCYSFHIGYSQSAVENLSWESEDLPWSSRVTNRDTICVSVSISVRADNNMFLSSLLLTESKDGFS